MGILVSTHTPSSHRIEKVNKCPTGFGGLRKYKKRRRLRASLLLLSQAGDNPCIINDLRGFLDHEVSCEQSRAELEDFYTEIRARDNQSLTPAGFERSRELTCLVDMSSRAVAYSYTGGFGRGLAHLPDSAVTRLLQQFRQCRSQSLRTNRLSNV